MILVTEALVTLTKREMKTHTTLDKLSFHHFNV